MRLPSTIDKTSFKCVQSCSILRETRYSLLVLSTPRSRIRNVIYRCESLTTTTIRAIVDAHPLQLHAFRDSDSSAASLSVNCTPNTPGQVKRPQPRCPVHPHFFPPHLSPRTSSPPSRGLRVRDTPSQVKKSHPTRTTGTQRFTLFHLYPKLPSFFNRCLWAECRDKISYQFWSDKILPRGGCVDSSAGEIYGWVEADSRVQCSISCITAPIRLIFTGPTPLEAL